MILTAVPESVKRAANSEARKVVSVRAYAQLAAVLVAASVVAFAALGLTLRPEDWKNQPLPEPFGFGAILVAAVLALAVVLAGVFGAESAGAEYRYGTLGISALFTPDRNVLLGSKLGVTALFSLATVVGMELLGGGAFLLFARGEVSLGWTHVAILGGVALAAVCWSVIGAALGFLLRTPTRAVVAVVGLMVLEPLIWLIANAIGLPALCTVLPVSTTVGTMTGDTIPESVAFIAPTPAAMVLLLLWTAGAVTAAWWDFTRRDLADTSAPKLPTR
ncbi:ABC transporter permease [Nocardia huaxiensis]|uniref:ABC transporter permease n=1 Tax=Nocardia huaxiensis TaxID=2755382 RepID=A0A7D6ZJV9_9NOCA|nr:ABC transporter permease [Nocardia huaxiensis]QLY32859.1 ABC transporter permease [Nocardia huaxiensis]UFS93385.1 ABC transporter permease [Nocardia huaxiensis]